MSEGWCSRLFAKGQIVPLPNKDRPSDVLKTLRILIEHGGSDPMLTDDDGYTAVHQHTGLAEQFDYLINQDHFQIDLLQRNRSGYTVAEHHAGWCWSESHRLSGLAWEKERMANQQKLHPLQKPWLHDSSTVELLHRTATHLMQHFQLKETTEASFLLIRHLIEQGTDPHAKRKCSNDLNSFAGIPKVSLRGRCNCTNDFTPLARLPNTLSLGSWTDWENPQALRQDIKTKNVQLNELICKWVKTLCDAGVEIKKYMQEEERQSLQRKKYGDWRSRCWNLSRGSRVDWEFHYQNRAEDCFITGTYEVRSNHNIEVVEKIPGAWRQELDHCWHCELWSL